jgi:hypothetical protein
VAQSTTSSPHDQFVSLRDQLAGQKGLPFLNILSRALVEAACRQAHHQWRERIYTPWITLSLFLSQILADDHSCDDAVDRFQKFRYDQGLPEVAPETTSYCDARRRLPEGIFWDLVRRTGQSIHQKANESWLFHGRPVKIVDGSTVIMPDTPENQAAYPSRPARSPASASRSRGSCWCSVQPRLKGELFLIRYADDFVMGFSHEEDARRVLEVLPKRFVKYGLTIHPDKTRLVPFERPDHDPKRATTERRELPGTFDLLGFTHFWSRSLRGNWVVKRTTSRSRLSRGLKVLSDWCRQNRHLPVAEQHRSLSQKLVGHFAYYGITGNSVALSLFRRVATQIWRRWLSRRRRAGRIPWDEFKRFLERFPLPPPIAIHSVCRRVART